MIRVPYIVEMSTPDDDIISAPVAEPNDALALFDSITVSDDRIPRVSVFFLDDSHCLHEIRRKETDAWRKGVEIAKAEIDGTSCAGDWKQWIADMYHCSECWGHRMTEDEMRLDLVESRKQADPCDYVPDPSLAAQCASYWNELCELYPN